MLQFFRTKSFRIIAAAAVLVALYALAGFVIAPKLVRSVLLEDIPKSMAVAPSVGAIHINPFLFQATIEDFSLAGTGGRQLLGFRRLFVDFELSSIWHRAYSFANIDIAAPYLAVAITQDGSLNLLQLRPKPRRPQPDEKNSALPALRIGSFKVSQGLVTYDDRSRPDAFAARLEPINFELREFTTGVEGGKFTLTGASKLGERLEWHGHVSVDPIESDGEFRVTGLLARTLWEYLQDGLNFVVGSGTVDLAGTYKFSLDSAAGAAEGTDNLQLDLSKLVLSGLTVRPKASAANDSTIKNSTEAGAAPPWITAAELTVTDGSVDVAKRRAHIDLVTLTGVKLLTWLEPGGTVNLLALAGAPPSASGAPPSGVTPASATLRTAPAIPPATTLTTSSSAPAAPWTFDLRQLDLRDASISAEDRTVQPALKVLLAPLSLQVKGASQDLTKPVSVTLATRIDDAGSLAASGEVTPQPATANLSLKLSEIDLTVLQPYIAQHTAMTLLDGRLGADAKLRYGTATNPTALQFAGDIHIDKLHTVDDVLHDDFIDWDRLDILGLNYDRAPDRLDIDKVVARKIYARVLIEPDESLNVKRVLKIPPAAATKAVAVKPTATKPAATDVPAAAKSPSRTMPVSIKQIVVQAGQANFADLSVTPNFAATIKELEGTILGLSSKPGSRAKVDLHGAIDAFSPVSITGEVNVLGPLYTDLAMSFRNISLAVFNPYSGKFAGYNITKGKLTTELDYKIDGRKLDAQHHIMIDQLEFGDKTASKDAVSLPIKLAVSLLKDRNGLIDLDVPVTGSLDDPKFRLAPIIWKVLVNILERAVTAPFALLGSLFGGGADIQYIDFQPGISTLDAAATDKAKAVAKALIERPQLRIDLPIAVIADVDRPALVAARLNAQLLAMQAAKSSPKAAAAGGTPPAFDQLDPAAQLALFTQLYAKEVGGEPAFPGEITHLKSKAEMISAKRDFLNEALRKHVVISEEELRTLGQQRAMALQQVLLSDTQLAAERVFLVANDKATLQNGAVRLELTLE